MKRLLCLFLLLTHPGFGDAQLSDVKQSLRQLKRKKNDALRQHSRELHKERSVLKDLDQLQNELDAKRRDYQTDQHNLAIFQARLATLQERTSEGKLDIDANREKLSSALRVIYKSGTLGEASLLFSAKDPAELLSRYRFLKAMARENALRLIHTKARLAEYDQDTRDNQVMELNYENLMKAAEGDRRLDESLQRKQTQRLSAIRREKSDTEGLLGELEEQAKNLDDKLQEILAARRAEEQAEAAREQTQHLGSVALDSGPSRLGRHHSLPWPVRGRLLTLFGEQMHPRFHTKVFNRGIEIAAPLGSPVIAVAPGTARFADYFEGYGQMVILDHGGNYFTVYGHNAQLSIKEGDHVEQGQEIAELGESSSSGTPSLYFEIRALDKAVDPLLWLKP